MKLGLIEFCSHKTCWLCTWHLDILIYTSITIISYCQKICTDGWLAS